MDLINVGIPTDLSPGINIFFPSLNNLSGQFLLTKRGSIDDRLQRTESYHDRRTQSLHNVNEFFDKKAELQRPIIVLTRTESAQYSQTNLNLETEDFCCPNETECESDAKRFSILKGLRPTRIRNDEESKFDGLSRQQSIIRTSSDQELRCTENRYK